MRLIVDAHLDLAINALGFDRDLTGELAALNAAEQGMTDHPARGGAVVTLPEMRRGRVAVCLATFLARSNPSTRTSSGYRRVDFDYASQDIAHAVAYGQLGYYRLLHAQGQIRIIKTLDELKSVWARWSAADSDSDVMSLPIGVVLSMEGCDPIVNPDQAQLWWDIGLRTAGLAHYGASRYAGGTGSSMGLTPDGKLLLAEFERLGMGLDLTHLSERAFYEAAELYTGPVLASHNNCRALVSGDRQFSDEQIQMIADRGGVIGVALDAWMLARGWVRGSSTRELLAMSAVVDHIDHICSVTGSCRHVAVGSDLDGGFGTEQTPRDCNSITDLQKIGSLLTDRGYSNEDVEAIMNGNWLRFLETVLPERSIHTEERQ